MASLTFTKFGKQPSYAENNVEVTRDYQPYGSSWTIAALSSSLMGGIKEDDAMLLYGKYDIDFDSLCGINKTQVGRDSLFSYA